MKLKYHSKIIYLSADTFTPVGLYLRLRDRYSRALLLESSDHHGSENCRSFICLDPLTEFREEACEPGLLEKLRKYMHSHERLDEESLPVDGIFGYTSYEAVSSFDPSLAFRKKPGLPIPLMQYAFYRFVIGINHFNDEMFILENIPQGETSSMGPLLSLIQDHSANDFYFELTGTIQSTVTDPVFSGMVKNGKEQCCKGNIFQVVLSRPFTAPYLGDEFNVYRSLRRVNPSPYLFYYDGGDFRIFGSSPEAQVIVKNNKAFLYPIAGTFRRSGNEKEDMETALALQRDPKEISEHMMLVDLARNDLSRSCKDVVVEKMAEIQYYSHVIHMVSCVSGKLRSGADSLELFASSFPAGTLTGAPKHRAMKLVDELEPEKRCYYGGALGYFGFNGDVNHAIIIRSFLAFQNVLHFRAGAGVVIASEEQGELAEVNNKVRALLTALEKASTNSIQSYENTCSR